MVATEFPPRFSAGVFRSLRFARYLPELSWKVHVLTIDPRSYEPPARIDKSLCERIPECVHVHRTAAIYPLVTIRKLRNRIGNAARALLMVPQTSTNRSFDEEDKRTGIGAGDSANVFESDMMRDGNTAQTTQSAASSSIQRLKDLISAPLMTPDTTIGWIPFAVRSGKQLLRHERVDVLYSSAPAWSNHLVALRLKRAISRPWVADFRDPWVDADFNSWRTGNSWAARTHQRLERRVLCESDAIILNTERSCAKLLTRNPDLPHQKLFVIPNGYDDADYESLPKHLPKSTEGRKLVVTHAGTFYGKRSIQPVLAAIRNLIAHGKLSEHRFELQLIGARRPGRDTEQRLVNEMGLQNVVQLLPRVPHSKSLQLLSAADVVLLIQVGASESVPGKVFEYIALRKPILTIASDGATAEFVRRENLGPCVSPDDRTAIEQTLMDLQQEFASGEIRAQHRESVRLRYEGRHLTRSLDRVFRSVMNPSKQ